VRLNAANRAFTAIVVMAGAVFGLFVGTACWVFAMVLYRLLTEGLTTLGDGGTVAGIVLIAFLVSANVLAIRSFRAQAANTRRLSRWVRERSLPLTPGLRDAAEQAHLGGKVRLVDAPEAFSFAYGMTRPTVAVSRGMIESVSVDELRAVLNHERYHVANYDPLKVVLARGLPDSLFFLPALAELRGRYAAGRELAADRRAVQKSGARSVAGALCKVISGPAGIDLSAAAAIGGDEALEARVNQLESGTEPPYAPIPPTRLLASVGGGAVLAWSAVASFVSFTPLMAKLCTGR
jgi:Zn-dependent protease with chaperone function